MSDASHAASLVLKLYELRTASVLRDARSWFAFEFHPTSARDVLATWLGPGHESAPYRMVTSYWDMAASFVVQGAIPAEMFNAANTGFMLLAASLVMLMTPGLAFFYGGLVGRSNTLTTFCSVDVH